jgi:hypothetical protein
LCEPVRSLPLQATNFLLQTSVHFGVDRYFIDFLRISSRPPTLIIMKSIIFGLSLVSAAVAQIANGVSMVSVPAPSDVNNNDGGSGSCEGSGCTPTTNAEKSRVTEPPSAPTQTQNFYSKMPYSMYNDGGYKSLNCGYGYSKHDDGSCQPEPWVRLQSSHFHCILIIHVSSSTRRKRAMAATAGPPSCTFHFGFDLLLLDFFF